MGSFGSGSCTRKAGYVADTLRSVDRSLQYTPLYAKGEGGGVAVMLVAPGKAGPIWFSQFENKRKTLINPLCPVKGVGGYPYYFLLLFYIYTYVGIIPLTGHLPIGDFVLHLLTSLTWEIPIEKTG